MSVQAMTRVMELSETSGVTRLVLLVIANHETEERGAFPSIDRIAHEARCDTRTVQRCIQRAAKLHELTVEKNAGPHGTNIYRTTPGTQAQIAGVAERRGGNREHESPPELKELGSDSSLQDQANTHLASLASTTRKSDAIFETLALVEGYDYSVEGPRPNKPEAARIGTSAANVRSAGVTDPDVLSRCISAWPRVFPDATCTAAAIGVHIGALRMAAETGLVARSNGEPTMREHLALVADETRARMGAP